VANSTGTVQKRYAYSAYGLVLCDGVAAGT
jgi:hypothetical protein